MRPWFLGGRLIALRKDGDTPSLRKLRPIAIGSGMGCLVSKWKCAADAASVRFQRLCQPPTARSCASRPRQQADGSPWPCQVGGCCKNVSEIASHAISAFLDNHPSFVEVSLHIRNAFYSLSTGMPSSPLLLNLTFLISFPGALPCMGILLIYSWVNTLALMSLPRSATPLVVLDRVAL